MAHVDMTVRVTILGLETGGWCDTCLLPSMVSVTYVLTVGGRMSIRTKTECRDHGGT